MTAEKKVVGLGELLWDLLPEGRQLGGAPANFSVMSARLGSSAVIASRIGKDDLGRDALAYLAPLPVDLSLIQTDTKQPTGSVSVTLSAGQAEYVIHEPVAWDLLEFTPQWRDLAAQADAVCYGTLAQREAQSRQTIQAFLAATRPECSRVFDVNLRRPFYSAEVIEQSLLLATVLKLNDAELPLVLDLLGLMRTGLSENTDDDGDGPNPATLLAGARLLLRNFDLEMVCVTLGGQGSLLVAHDGEDRHPGVKTDIVDTIGAGDAFTAALTHFFLQGAPLPVLNEAGNRWGSWAASQAGAMPTLSEAKRDEIEHAIAMQWK